MALLYRTVVVVTVTKTYGFRAVLDILILLLGAVLS